MLLETDTFMSPNFVKNVFCPYTFQTLQRQKIVWWCAVLNIIALELMFWHFSE